MIFQNYFSFFPKSSFFETSKHILSLFMEILKSYHFLNEIYFFNLNLKLIWFLFFLDHNYYKRTILKKIKKAISFSFLNKIELK